MGYACSLKHIELSYIIQMTYLSAITLPRQWYLFWVTFERETKSSKHVQLLTYTFSNVKKKLNKHLSDIEPKPPKLPPVVRPLLKAQVRRFLFLCGTGGEQGDKTGPGVFQSCPVTKGQSHGSLHLPQPTQEVADGVSMRERVHPHALSSKINANQLGGGSMILLYNFINKSVEREL